MTNFLLVMILGFVFAIFVMLFAFFLNQAKKQKHSPGALGTCVGTREEKNENFVKTEYFYSVNDDGPLVVHVRYRDGAERLFVLTGRKKRSQLCIYGADLIKLLGAAIEHQNGLVSAEYRQGAQE